MGVQVPPISAAAPAVDSPAGFPPAPCLSLASFPFFLFFESQSDDAVPIRWQCPEAVTTRVYTTKSDVYSYGVLLYEIFSGGATPHATVSTDQVLRAVQAGQRLPRPRADTTEDIVTLIRDCTQMDVARRPSMAHVHRRLHPEALLFVPGRTERVGAWESEAKGSLPLAMADANVVAASHGAGSDGDGSESRL